MADKKSKRVKCSACGKRITVCDLELQLSPYKCAACVAEMRKNKKISTPIVFTSHEFGDIEVLSFKAVAQEPSMKVCCSDCGSRTHSVGDVNIYFNARVKYLSTGKIVKWGAFFALPPKKYWCPIS